MDDSRTRRLLEDVRSGTVTIDNALEEMRRLPYERIGDYARLDHHRVLRCGFPEVVMGQGKTPEQILEIMLHLSARNPRVLATRVAPEAYHAIHERLPEAVYHPLSRCLVIDREDNPQRRPGVLVMTAGTADLSVAEEASLTAGLMGSQVDRLVDVGVAGLHRLLSHLERIQRARVIVVVAGMDGALASVVGGLVSAPVIAVPTSVGYGASFQGVATLLAMLNSCANGVAVVNIDNGFGAGYMAALINRLEPCADEAAGE